jgi:hypothetical protein
MANIVNNPSGGSVDGGGAKPTNLSREEILANALNDYRANLPETFTKILCNDGTTQNVGSNPLRGRVDMPCRNNGGVSNNQPIVVKPTTDEVKQQSLNLASRGMTQEDKFYEMLGIKKTYGGWGIQSRPLGRLLVLVVLVGGYFAYKKFKK